ncbi:hypothetical protein [Enterococcus termitis]|uniref:hypothetical protein n=1 Tax=Enterococcus termitis TaxID=332950 RepID=UPI00091AFEED|nr:hypothetical protein [Enterococcus termitis]OJG98482.1 hypothetical protein RV18_GL003383 [Enterococcus termitis]
MYILLIVSALILFIHSLLLVYIIQKNAELTNKINQLWQKSIAKKEDRSMAQKRNRQRK